MAVAALIYPHQLFADHPATTGVGLVVLVEEPLLFTQYRFHRQKLILHRATMQRFADEQRRRGRNVHYLEASDLPDTAAVAPALRELGITRVRYVEPCDDWLEQRLTGALASAGITAEILPDPCFLTPTDWIDKYCAGRQRFHFTEFYIAQRRRLGILVDDSNRPAGGKWSFDPANRRRLPKTARVPGLPRPNDDDVIRRARADVQHRFSQAIGSDGEFAYPTSHAAAERWLTEFLEQRLRHFGDYEDAISVQHDVLYHSLLSPLLNVGLLSPRQVVDAALARASHVPINSLEGFVRQVIGWREFVRLVYLHRGRRQRSRNFWGFTRAMPAAFYSGQTGIAPVDHVIRKVQRSGYCHHIERLMILGSFMLLCEVHPDAVYQWFMEFFIDAYDWVMVPNVYGMSQYADGGLMTTKPYVCGSSYVRRMSDFPRGEWCAIWDALFWRFVDRHAEVFAANPRMAMMVRLRDRLGRKLDEHRRRAESFLSKLHG